MSAELPPPPPPPKGKPWPLILAVCSVVVAVVAVTALVTVLLVGNDERAKALSDSAASPAIPPSSSLQGDPSTTPMSSLPSPTSSLPTARTTPVTSDSVVPPTSTAARASDERIAELVEAKLFKATPELLGMQGFLVAMADSIEARDGLLWAPNDRSTDEILRCTRAEWVETVGLREILERALRRAMIKDPALSDASARRAFAELPQADLDTIEQNLNLHFYFFYRCAGFSQSDSENFAAQQS